MGWVRFLPNVSVKVLTYRNRLQQGIEEAETLERRAAKIRENVRAAQEPFEKHITDKWGGDEVEKIVRKYSDDSFDHRNIFDKPLRAAIMSMHDNLGPSDALEIFEKQILSRQEKHIRTANPEVMELLGPIIEWWVHAGGPALSAVKQEQTN